VQFARRVITHAKWAFLALLGAGLALVAFGALRLIFCDGLKQKWASGRRRDSRCRSYTCLGHYRCVRVAQGCLCDTIENKNGVAQWMKFDTGNASLILAVCTTL
jgi:hypothetical protein